MQFMVGQTSWIQSIIIIPLGLLGAVGVTSNSTGSHCQVNAFIQSLLTGVGVSLAQYVLNSQNEIFSSKTASKARLSMPANSPLHSWLHWQHSSNIRVWIAKGINKNDVSRSISVTLWTGLNSLLETYSRQESEALVNYWLQIQQYNVYTASQLLNFRMKEKPSWKLPSTSSILCHCRDVCLLPGQPEIVVMFNVTANRPLVPNYSSLFLMALNYLRFSPLFF